VVAFLASPALLAAGEFGSTGSSSDDLYVVDMRDGLTRVQSLRRLTAVAAGSFTATGRVEPIEDLGVSPSGEQIAFSSRRSVFPLGSPAYVSPPVASSSANAGPQELYDVDLENDTLTRVTQGFQGEPTSQPSSASTINFAPSFGNSEDLLAFASSDVNLVFGDGNGASDVFLAPRKRFHDESAQQYISPPPAAPAIERAWNLVVRAHSRRDGSVVLEITVPGAGQLSASARGIVSTSARRHTRGGAPRRSTRGRPARAKKTVASAAKPSRRAGVVYLRLVPGSRYRPLTAKRGGLRATATVTLRSPAHRPLLRRVAVRFVRARHHRRAGGAKPGGSHAGHRARGSAGSQ
jgi:hypothetical protein